MSRISTVRGCACGDERDPPSASWRALTVSGKTVAENVAGAQILDSGVIKTLAEPWSKGGGLAVLRGNLAPNSAITKPAAIQA